MSLTRTFTSTQIHARTHAHTRAYVYIYIYIYVCMYIYTWGCVYICICAALACVHLAFFYCWPSHCLFVVYLFVSSTSHWYQSTHESWLRFDIFFPFHNYTYARYPGGNPAPVYHNGRWYLTNQKTTDVYTTIKLDGGIWTKYANISHSGVPPNWMIEGAFPGH